MKLWGGRFSGREQDADFEKFSESFSLDQRLVLYDLEEFEAVEAIRDYVLSTGIPTEKHPGWKCNDYHIALAERARTDNVTIGLAIIIKYKGGDPYFAHFTNYAIANGRVYRVEPQTGVVSNWDGWRIIVDK